MLLIRTRPAVRELVIYSSSDQSLVILFSQNDGRRLRDDDSCSCMDDIPPIFHQTVRRPALPAWCRQAPPDNVRQSPPTSVVVAIWRSAHLLTRHVSQWKSAAKPFHFLHTCVQSISALIPSLPLRLRFVPSSSIRHYSDPFASRACHLCLCYPVSCITAPHHYCRPSQLLWRVRGIL